MLFLCLSFQNGHHQIYYNLHSKTMNQMIYHKETKCYVANSIQFHSRNSNKNTSNSKQNYGAAFIMCLYFVQQHWSFPFEITHQPNHHSLFFFLKILKFLQTETLRLERLPFLARPSIKHSILLHFTFKNLTKSSIRIIRQPKNYNNQICRDSHTTFFSLFCLSFVLY